MTQIEEAKLMEGIVDEIVTEFSTNEGSSVIADYLEFVEHFEQIADDQLEHKDVRNTIKDIAALQNDPRQGNEPWEFRSHKIGFRIH